MLITFNNGINISALEMADFSKTEINFTLGQITMETMMPPLWKYVSNYNGSHEYWSEANRENCCHVSTNSQLYNGQSFSLKSGHVT